MLTIDVEQGSPEWLAARLCIPTASEFGKIITGTGLASQSKAQYMRTLLAEWKMQKPIDSRVSEWMKRGTELEPEAREHYEMVTGRDVDQVGMVYMDDRRLCSASPDGIVGKDGGLEIKCPKPETQIKYLLDEARMRKEKKPPTVYIPQVQGNMLVTGRQWWDWYSYHPDLDPVLIRVPRDTAYIMKMRGAIEDFIKQMIEKRKILT